MKKELVILTQYFLPEMGAPQNRLYDLARGLVNLGWNVRVITALPNYPTGKIFPSYRGKFTHREDLEGIVIKRYWLFPSNSARALPRIISMISFSITCLCSVFFIRDKPVRYLLVESPPLTLAVSAWILAKLSGARLILNISDIWPLSARELGAIRDGFLYRRLEALEQWLYKRAWLCSGQSQEIVDHIKRSVSDKTYLFRNGVDTRRFEVDILGSVKTNKIVYAGLLGVAQGILSICENVNFARHSAELHIYGNGAECDKIVAFINENPGRGIYYHGMVKRDEIPSILSEYSAYLVPLVKNIYGAVPSKIYEAMAAGLPILFSGDGEGATIVRQMNAGWVSAPGDWDSLNRSIESFVQLPESTYRKMRHNNMTVAAAKFDRNNQISEFSKFLIGHE